MNKRTPSPRAQLPSGAAMVARRVLLIDSDQDTLDRNTAHLQAVGHQVVTITDPAGAWELALRLQPDVIVLDVRLRRGFDGLELMQRLRLHPATAPIPIVVLTGFVFPTDDKLAMLAGCAAYLTKPCAPAVLLKEVIKANQRSRTPGTRGSRDRTSW
jgi:CheY-like chemotaxis protein